MKNKKKLIPFEKLKTDLMKNPEFVLEYEKLEPEFAVARAIIDARVKKKITQADLAKRMKTGQAVISRLENGNSSPTLALLQRLAEAINSKLEIRFIPR